MICKIIHKMSSIAAIASGLRPDLKCWGVSDTVRGLKAKDLTSSTAWRRDTRREEAVDNLPWQAVKEPSPIRPITRAIPGNRRTDLERVYELSRARRYYLGLNWAELSSCVPTTRQLLWNIHFQYGLPRNQSQCNSDPSTLPWGHYEDNKIITEPNSIN